LSQRIFMALFNASSAQGPNFLTVEFLDMPS